LCYFLCHGDDGDAADDMAVPFGNPDALTRRRVAYAFGERSRDVSLESCVEAVFLSVEYAVQANDGAEIAGPEASSQTYRFRQSLVHAVGLSREFSIVCETALSIAISSPPLQ
jgi:hypothetical protein